MHTIGFKKFWRFKIDFTVLIPHPCKSQICESQISYMKVPFQYGRTVSGDDFINQKNEIKDSGPILSRASIPY